MSVATASKLHPRSAAGPRPFGRQPFRPLGRLPALPDRSSAPSDENAPGTAAAAQMMLAAALFASQTNAAVADTYEVRAAGAS
jgi:hypothetical protein